MSRAARVIFALLVVATFAAFFVAQRIKASPDAVERGRATEFFSPNGDGVRDVARIRFRLKERDDVTVDVIDADDNRVRRLATRLRPPRTRRVRLRWNGRTDEGRRAPDGLYRVRIGLRRGGRSVRLPYRMTLDTTAPSPAVIAAEPPVMAPGAGPVAVRIRGAGQRRAPEFRVLRTDVEPHREVARFSGRAGSRRAEWDGLTSGGEPAGPGTYLIVVSARDVAGNVGTGPRLPAQPGTVEGMPGVTVRGLAVQPPVRPVRTGERFTVFVDARGRSYRWSMRRLGEPRPRRRSRGRRTSGRLSVRAPGGVSGVYLLEVRSGRYGVSVPIAVQSGERERVLVVLPTITWLGRDRVDDDRDGLPNTLGSGTNVRYPRPLVGDRGLPEGFAREVAPLLVHLDRARLRYDVTTDLALSEGRDPRATDRPGVLFAGSARWLTRPLGRRLRRYVTDGGRVALFGTETLRAGVTLGGGRLTRATAIGPADALGARIAALRRPELPEGTALELQALQDDPELGLLAGSDGVLGGFSALEEMISPGERAELLVGVGQAVTDQELLEAEERGVTPREARSALTAVRLGQGVVIRVGLPEWVPRLDDDPEVAQITRNVADLLRRVRPRPRSPVG